MSDNGTSNDPQDQDHSLEETPARWSTTNDSLQLANVFGFAPGVSGEEYILSFGSIAPNAEIKLDHDGSQFALIRTIAHIALTPSRLRNLHDLLGRNIPDDETAPTKDDAT